MPARGRDSETVMLINVAPGAQLEKKTINSLRYGQMFVSNRMQRRAGQGKNGASGSRVGVRERLSNRLSLNSAPTGQQHARKVQYAEVPERQTGTNSGIETAEAQEEPQAQRHCV